MAEYRIEVEAGAHLVRVEVTGLLTKEDGDVIITSSRTEASKHGFDLLYDMRDARTDVPLGEWFFLPRRLDALKGAEAAKRKAAVLVTADEIADYKFYEDVARNAGLSFQVFLEEAEARAWLAVS